MPGTWVRCTLFVRSSAPLPESIWPFDIRVGTTAAPNVATLDTAMVLLSAAANGAIGYDEPQDGRGRGFRVPKDYPSSLRFASFMLGNSADYLVDHFYFQPFSAGANRDWATTETLSRIIPPEHADEHWRGSMSDVGHARPCGLTVVQNWYENVQVGYKDLWAIGAFDFTNNCDSTLSGLYAGIIADMAVAPFPDSNTVHLDTIRRAIYAQCQTYDCPTAGVVLLDPAEAANLAALDCRDWLWPDSCLTDAQKYAMLAGSIRTPDSLGQSEWLAVASAGPFDLAPGMTRRLAVAFVGHIAPDGWLIACDTAQAWYDRTFYPVGLSAERLTPDAERLTLSVAPTICRGSCLVRFLASPLESSTPRLLSVFSPSGRRIRSVAVPASSLSTGSWTLDVAGLPSGIYFATVSGSSSPARLVVTR
jgi:hypothetical protein